MQNVLVVCTGNSCRSIMAEAMINQLGAGLYKAFSAGSRPTGHVRPEAIESLKRHGIEPGAPYSKSLDALDLQHFDTVITVCDNAANEACPFLPRTSTGKHWPIPDPAAASGSADEANAAFDEAFAMLKTRIEKELLSNA